MSGKLSTLLNLWGEHIYLMKCVFFFFFKREKQDSTMRNPSAIIRFDKQCAHLAHCCCCPGIFLSFTLTFRRCIVMLHCCLLAFLQQLLLSPAHPRTHLPPPFFPQPPQNHLFFSNQIQHLEEKKVPRTAFVLCVRTDFRLAEAQCRTAVMICPKYVIF